MVVRTLKSASRKQVTRRLPRRSCGTVAALVTLCVFLATGSTRAYGQVVPPPVENAEVQALPASSMAPEPASPTVLAAPPMPPPANPALDLRTEAPEHPSVFERWWFWTAVGAAVAATVVIVVVSSRGHAPPATDLGNQEFQP